MEEKRLFEGVTVVTTGLDDRGERFVREKVEAGGGTFKPSFVKSLDMLVFNPTYYRETVKMRSTKELIDAGHPVKMVTFNEFCEMVANDDGSVKHEDLLSRGFHIEGDELVKYIAVTEDTEVVIPESVHVIGVKAFEHCGKTKKVVFPDGVISINDFAFANCDSIEEIVLNDGLKTIGNAAFGDCPNLRAVNIPDSVESMGPQVFAGCFKLQSITLPESVSEIGWNMFLACESLTTLNMGSKVSKIGNNAFERCKSLTSIKLPESVGIIPAEAFKECSGLKEIRLPENVMVIERNAFEGCSALESISHSHRLVQIKEGAFKNCSSLKEIDLPVELRTIRAELFDGCTSLKEIAIPEGVTRIEKYAFADCKSLEKIVIPESMEVINGLAFYDASKSAFNKYGNGLYLEWHGNPYYWFILPANYDVKSCEINPETVKIALDALSISGDIKEIIIPKNIEDLQTVIGSGTKRVIIYDNLQNARKALEGGGTDFYREIVIKSADTDEILSVVPVHNEIIGAVRGAWLQGNRVKFSRIDSAFNSTKSKEAKIRTSITRLMYPKNLDEQYKEQYLAYLNTNSKAVIMQAIADEDIDLITLMGSNGLLKKASIKAYIEESTKRNAVAITAYLLNFNIQPKESIPKPPKQAPKIAKKIEASLSEWEFKKLDHGCLEIKRYKGGKKKKIEVPDSFHDKRIISIGESAFSGRRDMSCIYIEKVVIPEGIKHIGNKAFYHCEKLKKLTLPSTLEEIGDEAFSGCRKMESFNLPDSVNKIGRGAFSYCSGITSFSFPAGVKEVSENIFDGCYNLENATIRSDIVKIGKGAFNGCKRLKQVNLPKTIQSVGPYAFSGCLNLEEIELPDSLKTIGEYAFSGCSLFSITVPEGTQEIGYEAFFQNRILEKVTLPDSLKIIGGSNLRSEVFDQCNKVKAYAPKGSFAEKYCIENGIPLAESPDDF